MKPGRATHLERRTELRQRGTSPHRQRHVQKKRSLTAKVIVPVPFVRVPVLCYVPSHWKLIGQDGDCTLFKCEGFNDLLLDHSADDESHEPEDTRITGMKLLMHREDQGFEGVAPVHQLENGFEMVYYAGNHVTGMAVDGREHYCEIVGYVKPKTRVILCYQTVLPDKWRDDRRLSLQMSLQMSLILRSAAQTRYVNPIEAQWFRNPRLAPKGFLDAPFVYKMPKPTHFMREAGLRRP